MTGPHIATKMAKCHIVIGAGELHGGDSEAILDNLDRVFPKIMLAQKE